MVKGTIRVKQECPQSATLFGPCTNLVVWKPAKQVCIAIPILSYVDDVVLISKTSEGLQRHPTTLKVFSASTTTHMMLNFIEIEVCSPRLHN